MVSRPPPPVLPPPAVNQASPDSAPPAFVVLRIAGRPGPAFPLDAAADNPLGRAAESFVVLGDRLASRAHATIRRDHDRGIWLLRDLGSRNGTWLDGRRVGEAPLADGGVIRIGTTELVFRMAGAAGTPGTAAEHRLVRSGPPAELEGAALRRAAGGADARWQMLLYQAGLRLLAATTPRAVVCTTLELAAEFTAASSFGWFEPAVGGGLGPRCVVPPTSDLPNRVEAMLADTLAGSATWLAGDEEKDDVASVPVMSGGRIAAVLAAAAPAHCLREADFDLLVLLASLAGAAWSGAGSGGNPRSTDATTDPFDDELAVGDPPPPVDGTLALSAEGLRSLQADLDPAGLVGGAGSLRLDDWQRTLVVEALRRTAGAVPEAAALLGVSRATLYRRLEAYGLTRDGTPDPP